MHRNQVKELTNEFRSDTAIASATGRISVATPPVAHNRSPVLAVSQSKTPQTERKQDSGVGAGSTTPHKKLVFGLIDKAGDSNLVFIREDDAKRLARVHEAIHTTKRWGSFCRKMPPEDLRYVVESYRDRDEKLPAKKGHYSLPGAFWDGDWPDWPEQMMLQWMPEEIVEKYGKDPCSVLNGHFLTLQMADAEEIILTLEREGFTCRLDEELVRQACGHVGGSLL